MPEPISTRVVVNLIALGMSLAAAACFFPSFVTGLAIPGFVLALVGLKHSASVRRAGSDTPTPPKTPPSARSTSASRAPA
jgi:hypothetical protein